MRRSEALQRPLVPIPGGHQIARELQIISTLLDRYPEIAQLAHADLSLGRRADVGRKGLTGEQVIRVALLKQMNALSYRELAFYLEDSTTFQAFARLPFGRRVKWTTLQMNVKRLRAETWEAINRTALRFARENGIESGKKVRIDTTAVEANVHEPTDSSLLWDCVRVVTRLLHRVSEDVPNAHVPFTDHARRAKRRAYALKFPPRGKTREGHMQRAYRDLLKVAGRVYRYGRATIPRLEEIACTNRPEALTAQGLAAELKGFVASMQRVIDQAERRVIHGEKVPSSEKLLSIFETHTTVVVKGERDVVFGHKVCLTGGVSLILDCVTEQGNPADATLVERSIRRHLEIYGAAPRQATFDGGFASKINLQVAKDLGVKDVAFHKRCGLAVTDMVKSISVFRALVRFRTGIEGYISALKRNFRMDRCSWRNLPSFQSYVWVCVVSFNLRTIARHLNC